MICVYRRAFSVWSTQVENTKMAPGSENRRSVWFSDSLWLTHYSIFFFLPPKVKVLPVRPVLQLKVQFCQMALPTPVAAPAPAISPAPPKSRSTPSNPVPWRVLSPQTTSTLGVTVMEWPTKLALAKVQLIRSCTCWCVCVCMCGWDMLSKKTATMVKVNAKQR